MDYWSNKKNALNEMARIKSTYLLMKKTNLLNYYGLYYDKQKNELLITMEPLKQTLAQYVAQKIKKNHTHLDKLINIIDLPTHQTSQRPTFNFLKIKQINIQK